MTEVVNLYNDDGYPRTFVIDNYPVTRPVQVFKDILVYLRNHPEIMLAYSPEYDMLAIGDCDVFC